jgi:GTP-binding protein
MSFVDKVNILMSAGKGGDGKLGFRHEKFISMGGPDGGDGGKGGDVVLVASRNQNTLAAFRFQKELHAADGNPGGQTRKHGRNGKDLLVAVPVGTVAYNEAGQVVADLVADGQEQIVAQGGRGGFGNAHFVSSRRQAPKFAEKGDPGNALNLKLEIKMIADVGLVGLPNAGKSTLLATLSNARPEIADYPFTTLTPNLGVVDIDKTSSLLMADIPGLIEGAARGKGLGHDFLRHVERTAVILHMIDAYQENVANTYTTIRAELAAYQTDLTERPEIIALNKIDGLDQEIVDDLVAQLETVAPDTLIVPISAQAGTNTRQLIYALQKVVVAERAVKQAEAKEAAEALPILTLSDTSDEWSVSLEDGIFTVTGQKIEQFARRTDFSNEEGVQRLRDIMRRMGILHELVRKHIEPGQTIRIHGSGDIEY